jgi:hypothetical protein
MITVCGLLMLPSNEQGPLPKVDLIAAVIFLGVGIALPIMGYFFYRKRNWARVVTIVLLLLIGVVSLLLTGGIVLSETLNSVNTLGSLAVGMGMVIFPMLIALFLANEQVAAEFVTGESKAEPLIDFGK